MANSDPSREYRLIEKIREFCGDASSRWEKGIGDDCAVRNPSEKRMLLTADSMVENIHFRLDLISLKELGFKAIAGSVSDIYAMGGTAESIAINLVFPKSADSTEKISELYEGIGEAVQIFGTPIIGGDMSSGPCWVISVTVLGDSSESVKYRSGAKPGDIIWATGTPGLSGLGLDLLLNHGRVVAESIDTEAVRAHIRPVPHFDLAEWIQNSPQISSMIDISDGVGKEVLTIAKESGTGAIVQVPESVRHRLSRNCDYTRGVRSAEELFLSGGEDYELLFTASPEFMPESWGTSFVRIGMITENRDCYFITANGAAVPLTGGWDHM